MAYSQEQKDKCFERIIEHIEEGNSLRSALDMHDMPSSQTFYIWLNEDADKSKRYARACEERATLIFEEILDIADESHSDKKVLEDGREVVDGEVVQRSRLRIDARKWMLSKMNPKKYGDKLDMTTDGESLNVSPAERAKRIAELKSKLNGDN